MRSCLLGAKQRALSDYKGKRGGLPKVVVLYRDGVSEGEYARVEQEEIRRLEGTWTIVFMIILIYADADVCLDSDAYTSILT